MENIFVFLDTNLRHLNHHSLTNFVLFFSQSFEENSFFLQSSAIYKQIKYIPLKILTRLVVKYPDLLSVNFYLYLFLKLGRVFICHNYIVLENYNLKTSYYFYTSIPFYLHKNMKWNVTF